MDGKADLAWATVLLAIGGTAGGLGYYKYAEISAAIAAAEAFPEPREAVEAVRVRRGEWAASTRAVGTVVALRQVELRNELAGTVVEMGFASGDIVEAGQVLVRLDTRSAPPSRLRRRKPGWPNWFSTDATGCVRVTPSRRWIWIGRARSWRPRPPA